MSDEKGNSVRDALTDPSPAPHPRKRSIAESGGLDRETVARESADRYRSFVSDLNRTRDREMERALRG